MTNVWVKMCRVRWVEIPEGAMYITMRLLDLQVQWLRVYRRVTMNVVNEHFFI